MPTVLTKAEASRLIESACLAIVAAEAPPAADADALADVLAATTEPAATEVVTGSII